MPAAPPLPPVTPPSVTFVAGVRPEASTRVALEGFEGPLGLLLSLIEQRQLDILSVPLGELAAAYLEALGRLESASLGHLSAFVAVAAQLILIKSRALLPREPVGGEAGPALEDEGVDPEAELRRRLIVYRAYRDAGAWLAGRASPSGWLFHREAGVAAAAGIAGAVPDGTPLDPAELLRALRRSSELVLPPQAPPEMVRRTITLAERAELIRAALRSAPLVVLQDLLEGLRDRVLVAVTFLAMLELVKRGEVRIEQDVPWGPIRCLPGERPGTPAAAPIDESLEGFS